MILNNCLPGARYDNDMTLFRKMNHLKFASKQFGSGGVEEDEINKTSMSGYMGPGRSRPGSCCLSSSFRQV